MSKRTDPAGRSQLWHTLALAWELGYTIAVPLVVLAFGGRLFDRRLGTSPLLLLAGILCAIIASSIGVTVKVTRILREMK